MFTGKKALLLDMNGTFMFGEDRFGDEVGIITNVNSKSKPERLSGNM